jgi:hypothetical protein
VNHWLRPTATALVVAASVTLLGGAAGCDTRACVVVNTKSATISCVEGDVRGVVVSKNPANEGSHNPSLVVDTDRMETKEGRVRITLKETFWRTYDVGDQYP